MFSVRRWAVTVISWMVSPLVSEVSVAVAAWARPPADPLRIAAMAYESFELRSCVHPLSNNSVPRRRVNVHIGFVILSRE